MHYKDENVKLLIFERWKIKSSEAVKTRNKINNHNSEQRADGKLDEKQRLYLLGACE